MNHVACINESYHICSHLTPQELQAGVVDIYKWVTSHIYMWIGHVTHTNGSRCMYTWIVSHMQSSHATRPGGGSRWKRYIYKWVTSHVYMNGSRHIYQWVMSHICSDLTPQDLESTVVEIYKWVTSHIYMNGSRHTCKSVKSCICLSDVTPQSLEARVVELGVGVGYFSLQHKQLEPATQV